MKRVSSGVGVTKPAVGNDIQQPTGTTPPVGTPCIVGDGHVDVSSTFSFGGDSGMNIPTPELGESISMYCNNECADCV